MRGYIDTIFENDDGDGFALMELKTGKWRDAKVSDMRMEMSFYKFLIESSSEEELRKVGLDAMVTHWGWRYSAADHLDYEPVKKVSERAMMKRLQDLVRSYLHQDFTPTKADFKCSYCNYMQFCPRYNVYKGDEENDI